MPKWEELFCVIIWFFSVFLKPFSAEHEIFDYLCVATLNITPPWRTALLSQTSMFESEGNDLGDFLLHRVSCCLGEKFPSPHCVLPVIGCCDPVEWRQRQGPWGFAPTGAGNVHANIDLPQIGKLDWRSYTSERRGWSLVMRCIVDSFSDPSSDWLRLELVLYEWQLVKVRLLAGSSYARAEGDLSRLDPRFCRQRRTGSWTCSATTSSRILLTIGQPFTLIMLGVVSCNHRWMHPLHNRWHAHV